jgi:hypothetical protein
METSHFPTERVGSTSHERLAVACITEAWDDPPLRRLSRRSQVVQPAAMGPQAV